MSPVTDLGYAAAKQARYRARLRAREEDEANAPLLTPLVRAVIAEARSIFTPERDAVRVARSLWKNDEATLELVTRATSSFATTTDTSWAGPLARVQIEELLTTLGPASAGSQLLRQGLRLVFDGVSQIKCPGITASASYAGFVAQGAAIPVQQMTVSAGVTLEARKFAVIFALTRELAEGSNSEAMVRAVLMDSVAAALDVALLGNAAGDTTRPPGLLNGVSPITAATGGGGIGAMVTDLGALANAVAPLGGLNLAYVASPEEAVKISLGAGPQFKLPVLASAGLAAKTVVCVALPALVSATDIAPRIEAARDATMHFDTAPGDISGSTPVRSLYQTDEISVRLTMFVSWGLRATGAIAYVTGVNW